MWTVRPAKDNKDEIKHLYLLLIINPSGSSYLEV